MKLELKHLAGYLPYGLKFQLPDTYIQRAEILDTYNLNQVVKNQYKPILHPLSALTKEIEVNGEKFVPLDKIAIYGDESYLIEQIKTGLIEVIVWQMLLSWHFDIHGLIKKGLAVDINTLEK